MRGKRGGFATMPFCAPGALQRAGRYNFGKRKRENVGEETWAVKIRVHAALRSTIRFQNNNERTRWDKLPGYFSQDTGKPTLEPLASARKVPPISVHMEGLFWVFDCSYRQEPGANEAI